MLLLVVVLVVPAADQGLPVGRRRLRGRPQEPRREGRTRRRERPARRLRHDRRGVGRLGRRQHHLGDPRAEPVPGLDRRRVRRHPRRRQPARRARVEQGVRGADLPLHRQHRGHDRRRTSIRALSGDVPIAESAELEVQGESLSQAAFVLLLLRAFASGCAALTGVEAISNGVPAFRRPKIQNAQKTLVAMGAIAIVLFSGLVAVALLAEVHYIDCTEFVQLVGCGDGDDPQRSLIAQIASATFGNYSIPFFIIQAATAAVLLLAANTAFNGFPLLGSVLAARPLRAQGARHPRRPADLLERRDRALDHRDRHPGRVPGRRHHAHPAVHHRRVHLVHARADRHGAALAPDAARAAPTTAGAIWRGLAINAVGAVMTASVLIIVTVTKFTHGAWIVFVVMPILFTAHARREPLLPRRRQGDRGRPAREVRRRRATTRSCSSAACRSRCSRRSTTRSPPGTTRSRRCTSPSTTRRPRSSRRSGRRMNIKVPLRVLESPYRDISMPLIKYIKKHRRDARLRGRHGLHAAVHRRPLVGDVPAQPHGAPHPAQARARARRRRSRSCRGCSTRRRSSTAAARGRCPVRIAAASRCVRWCASRCRPQRRAAKKPAVQRQALTVTCARSSPCSSAAWSAPALRLGIDALLPHGDDGFPLSTLLINVARLVRARDAGEPGLARRARVWLRAGLGAGLLGSFTTFSAVVASVVTLTRAQEVATRDRVPGGVARARDGSQRSPGIRLGAGRPDADRPGGMTALVVAVRSRLRGGRRSRALRRGGAVAPAPRSRGRC